MSEAPSPHRVVVALDLSPMGLAALEAAANLAAELRAELRGLFVEDINLLRLAALPFAREVGYGSSVPRQLDSTQMEHTLRVKSERVRRAVASTAERARVQWSFEVTRGHVTRTSLAAGSEADWLLMGCESTLLGPPSRATNLPRPILVVYDGTIAGQQCLDAAACLARQPSEHVLVVLAGSGRESTDADLNHALKSLASRGVTAVAQGNTVPDIAALTALAAEHQAKLVLINRDHCLLDEAAAVESLVSCLECPVGLVR